MYTFTHLYSGKEDLEKKLKEIKAEKECLIQIFTSELKPNEAVELAGFVQEKVPTAKVIGSSASAIMHNGEQYDEATLIVAEVYDNVTLNTDIWSWKNLSFTELVEKFEEHFLEEKPQMMRIFFGNYYDYSHQFLNVFNQKMPDIKLVGGISGEVVGGGVTPYVFTPETLYREGVVFCGYTGDSLSTFSRINTAHEPISPIYTVTECNEHQVLKIEDQSAIDWLNTNIGFVSTQQYESWQDIADNDPLVRFQFILTDNNGASRFLRYDEESKNIAQYFSRFDKGTKFRISYTSPSKCVDDCREICMEIQKQPVEHVFFYSCLFRKMYLKNCASWELLPYRNYDVSGVFLLGEIGHQKGTNELFNGSCVMTGIAEQESYLELDMDVFDDLVKIQDENDGLLDFITKKKAETATEENAQLLSEMVQHEEAYHPNKYYDARLDMNNILKYEEDKEALKFNKICVIKIENADILISYYGQIKYLELLKSIIKSLDHNYLITNERGKLHNYTLAYDSFVIATGDEIDKETFIEKIKGISDDAKKLQEEVELPMLSRFIIVANQTQLLQRAYNCLQMKDDMQEGVVIVDSDDEYLESVSLELSVIETLNYAIDNGKIIPYYQGIYNNKKGCIDKYEALMRIETKTGEILTPNIFMDVAKKYRLYLTLTREMVNRVFEEFKHSEHMVSINLSSIDITSVSTKKFIINKLREFPEPSRIIIEILEDECFKDINILKEFIDEVREYGAKIAIDDFGAGYSNLLEIIRVNPDFIKIDGEIITDIHTHLENQLIVDAVKGLGEKMSIELVAEFVKNEDIQKQLEKQNIDFSQGFYFAEPKPFSELQKELKE